jgi:hypothetical protein
LHPNITEKTLIHVINWQWTYKENHDWRRGQVPPEQRLNDNKATGGKTQ